LREGRAGVYVLEVTPFRPDLKQLTEFGLTSPALKGRWDEWTNPYMSFRGLTFIENDAEYKSTMAKVPLMVQVISLQIKYCHPHR
jgi:hypothetical protein